MSKFKTKGFISRKSNISVKSKVSEDEYDVDDSCKVKPTLGYFRQAHQVVCIDVYIDESVYGPEYYRSVVHAIRNSTENDLIRFRINSNGGDLQGLQSLLSAIWSTDAITEAYIDGSCHSAASLLALNCDNIYVSPVAEMLCHHVRFGTGGKMVDVRGYLDHVAKLSEELLRNTYKDFLSDVELNDIINGKELYLTADEIVTRLEYKQELQDAQQLEEVLE